MTMNAPDFVALASRVLGADGNPALGARIAEELRLIWNARGAADFAKLESEIPNVWTMAEPAGALTRALRALDR